jgi:3-deoxy-D-manno-octulosonate 8-phosphate phosphatase (KDO 8-P phosphatase)
MSPQQPSHNLISKARKIQLLVLDVDGVLSDGRLYFSNSGEEIKNFHIQDGLGIKLLARGGVETAIITGRSSAIVARRAEQLGIRHVMQGREDKLAALQELCATLTLDMGAIAYMGDDLPDLAAIRRAGLGLTVANANTVVRDHADWISQYNGGDGAVREACELILDAQGKLQTLLDEYL